MTVSAVGRAFTLSSISTHFVGFRFLLTVYYLGVSLLSNENILDANIFLVIDFDSCRRSKLKSGCSFASVANTSGFNGETHRKTRVYAQNVNRLIGIRRERLRRRNSSLLAALFINQKAFPPFQIPECPSATANKKAAFIRSNDLTKAALFVARHADTFSGRI